ncbi:hypothetical protein [uncultured Kocuria sp.]|uniref:hypothetical protein n=1 Tax=uncultured Kocuria sp. TaxID=259305 RepID=UPI0026260278|nr:hypothetical protein [uncultured Kocuria sp.]
MQNTSEITIVVAFFALIVVCSVLMYGHRLLAQRLVNDPEIRPQRSVNFAAFWPLIVLATAFPLMALLAPFGVDEEPAGQWMMVGFFTIAVLWLLVVRKWDWYLRYATNTMFAVTGGSREHGETPEMYRDAFQRALPWATALMAVALAASLTRALI